MISVLAILAAAVVIAGIEVPSLWKKKMIKELWAFCILLSIGVYLSIAQSLRMKVPNPASGAVSIFKPISKFIFQLLQ